MHIGASELCLVVGLFGFKPSSVMLFCLLVLEEETSVKYQNASLLMSKQSLECYWESCAQSPMGYKLSWRRHDVEMLSALLAFCEGKLPVACGFTSQRDTNTDFWCCSEESLNNHLNKQLSGLSRHDAHTASSPCVIDQLMAILQRTV